MNEHFHTDDQDAAGLPPGEHETPAQAARLTAYALGELDEADRAAVEQGLAHSESAREELVRIRRSMEMVTAALATEPVGELSPDARRQLDVSISQLAQLPDRAQAAPRNWPIRSRRIVRRSVAACAACIVIGGLGLLLRPAMYPARESARRPGSLESIESPELHDQMEEVGVVPQDESVSTEPPSQRQLESIVVLPTQTKLESTARQTREIPYTVGGPVQKKSGDREVDYTVAKPVYETKTRPSMRMKNAQPRPAAEGAAERTTLGTDVYPVGDLVARESREGRSRLSARRDRLSDATKSSAPPAKSLAGQEIGDGLLVGGRGLPDGDLDGGGKSNTEAYDRIDENPFLDVRQNPLSTFSVDVDTASYANVRRFLNQNTLPPKDAVRIEELVNYFTYHYAPPAGDQPFAVHAEVASCPWQPKHRLLRIALKGREIDWENRPASNLVFLLDVSGSMDQLNKLPLLKQSLRLVIDKLGENDRVAMVVYAGSSGLVLPSTSAMRKDEIVSALDRLQAGGSTNGASGIELAYQVAGQNFIQGGTNRVVLATDGDFNVGITDQGALTRLIENEAKGGVFLSVLGFGMGNLKDATMEKLADRGNGNYAYIDTINEARKVLVEQLGGTLLTIAKDVKLQLDFNPRLVAGYRLIGYENRLLRDEDFNDDTKDAGEIGAGHTVTALYELVPAGQEVSATTVNESKYQRTLEPTEAAASGELLTLTLRYKEPAGNKSKPIDTTVTDAGHDYAQASEDFRFAASVAGFGLLLRQSQYKGDLTPAAVLELASASRGADEGGYRAEFIELVRKLDTLTRGGAE